MSDSAEDAARLSACVGKPGIYVSVLDGPRLTRPDGDAEVIRRNNAAARLRPRAILLAGLPQEAEDSFEGYFPASRTFSVRNRDALAAIETRVSKGRPPLKWGHDKIGLGLLTALYAGQTIEFGSGDSLGMPIRGRSNHLVVCEENNDLSQVIAANYAYSVGAGLCLIPKFPNERASEIMERFYTLYDNQDRSPTSELERLADEVRMACGPVPLDGVGSITFITSALPYGFGFPEVPTTHLFDYPDLGIAMINGLAAGQEGYEGLGVAVLVDPSTTDAPEIDLVQQALYQRGVLVRVYAGSSATVRNVQQAIELFPYDLLLVATHCGDTSGYRWTYEFTDSEGHFRTLVVDIAVSFGPGRREDDLVHVTQQDRFVSLDGVDWTDPKEKEKLYVGTAILDFLEMTRGDGKLRPIKRENIPRVVGSKVLRMADHNYLPLPKAVANNGAPIIINNACGSWDELAGTFMFGNARAYVGTLFMIGTTEAAEVVSASIDRHFGRPLAEAFWLAQNETYGETPRRPYVVSGVYPQALSSTSIDVPSKVLTQLQGALEDWRRQSLEPATSEQQKREVEGTVEYYEREVRAFKARWPHASHTPKSAR